MYRFRAAAASNRYTALEVYLSVSLSTGHHRMNKMEEFLLISEHHYQQEPFG
jgi:hypothetical protein